MINNEDNLEKAIINAELNLVGWCMKRILIGSLVMLPVLKLGCDYSPEKSKSPDKSSSSYNSSVYSNK